MTAITKSALLVNQYGFFVNGHTVSTPVSERIDPANLTTNQLKGMVANSLAGPDAEYMDNKDRQSVFTMCAGELVARWNEPDAREALGSLLRIDSNQMHQIDTKQVKDDLYNLWQGFEIARDVREGNTISPQQKEVMNKVLSPEERERLYSNKANDQHVTNNVTNNVTNDMPVATPSNVAMDSRSMEAGLNNGRGHP